MTDERAAIGQEEKPVPIIDETVNIDIPFSGKHDEDYPVDLIALNDQQHSHKVEDFKNTTGKHVLYLCIALMVVFALIDGFCKLDSDIFSGAFEAIKIIGTTVLGYIFGSKSSGK